MSKVPAMMRQVVDNWWFPASDQLCAGAILQDVKLVDSHWIPYAKSRRIALQAGGNVGIYPAALARHFGIVYTFEPELENFRCLAANCEQDNIYAFRAALGDIPGHVGLHKVPENTGAHWVEGAGTIPVLRIDDLRLPCLDLLALDIEGAELNALKGAEETILDHWPVLFIEEKGHIARFGGESQDLRDWLEQRDYVFSGYVRRDQVWLPKEIA